MVALAQAGYHAIAPDLRGYGLSEPHPEPEKASFYDFVEDTLSILDFFNIEKVHSPKPSCKNLQISDITILKSNFFNMGSYSLVTTND